MKGKRVLLIPLLLFFLSGMADALTVTDSIGRTVVLPERIERIGCLYAFTAHVVTMLGRGGDIEAVVAGSHRDRLLAEINPSILEAAVPSDDGILNIEEILKLHLDILFIKGETALLDSEREKLERFRLPFVVIDYQTIEVQMEAISIVGQAIGRVEEAEAYNSYYRATMESISRKLADLPENEKLRVYHSINEATRTDAPGTIGAQWVDLAGGINVSVNDPLRFSDNKHFASLEQIYLWNPDVILCNQEGVDAYILGSDKWSGLKAVREGMVYQIPVGISRWGHPGGMETPLALIWTAVTLYPDHFPDLDLKGEIRSFYGTFFDYYPSDAMISDILSGKGMRLPKGEL